MNAVTKILFLVAPILLSGCLPSNKKSSETGSTSPTQTTTTTSSSDTSASSDTEPEIIDNSKIDSISLNKRELEVQVGKTSNSLIVNYVFNIPESEVTDELKAVNWSIKDSNIASIDQYGRVTGKASGKTTVTCTSVEGAKKAYATIYVYPSGGSVTKKWLRLDNDNDLAPGDQLLFACPEKSKLATTETTGMYLHSTSATFSGNEVSNIGVAAPFVLGEDYKGRGGFTLEVPEREEGTYLGTSNTGKVSFYDSPKTTSVLWDVDYDNDQHCWDIRSHTNIDGWFMYNSSQDKFTTYQSNVQIDMFTVTLYRLTRV